MSSFDACVIGVYACAVAVRVLCPAHSRSRLVRLLLAEAELVQHLIHLPAVDVPVAEVSARLPVPSGESTGMSQKLIMVENAATPQQPLFVPRPLTTAESVEIYG